MNADYFCRQGIEKTRISDYEGGIEDYNQALKLNPDEAQVYSLRALSHAALADYQGVVEDDTLWSRLDLLQTQKLSRSDKYFVSFESLGIDYSAYERLDKRRKRKKN